MSKAGATADQAYETLMRMITFCELKPGSIVTESLLAQAAGVGRTPLREAVQRLTWDGVMKVLPRKGVQIPELSVEHQFQLLEVRRPLEAAAVHHAAVRRTAQQRAVLLKLAESFEALSAGDGQRRYDAILTQSHRSVVEAAHNPRFNAALGPSQALSRRFWFANMNDNVELENGARCHVAILRAVADGDENSAKKASKALLDYLEKFTVATIKSKLT